MSETILDSAVPRFLEQRDIRDFLRKEVERAGGQSAWSRKTGVHRGTVNRVLAGQIKPTKELLKALRLRVVYAIMDDRGNEQTRDRLKLDSLVAPGR
jgi:DNA-binding phage protein